MNPLSNFLCWCAGADIELLKQYPEDVTKQSSIGFSVLFTGIFAVLSGGYAAYRIFDYPNSQLSPPLNSHTYLAVGILWGFLIFNLDRFIVLSVKKTGSQSQLLLTTAPRLLLAILISLVIAKPLEIRIFQDRIAETLADIRLEKQLSDKNKIEDLTGLGDALTEMDEYDQKVELARQELNQDCNTIQCERLRGEIKSAQIRLEQMQKIVNSEYNTLSRDINWINNKKSEHWTFSFDENGVKIYRLKPESEKQLKRYTDRLKLIVNNRNRERNILAKLDSDLTTANNEFKQIKQQSFNDAEQKASAAAILVDSTKVETDSIFAIKSKTTNSGLNNNFVAQLDALGELTKWKIAEDDEEQPSNTMYWINLALIVLFIVVETAPILVKAIAPLTAYDYAIDEKLQTRRENIEKEKQRKQLEHQIYMQKSVHDYEAEIQHYTYTRSIAQSAALDTFNERVEDWRKTALLEDYKKLIDEADKAKPST